MVITIDAYPAAAICNQLVLFITYNVTDALCYILAPIIITVPH